MDAPSLESRQSDETSSVSDWCRISCAHRRAGTREPGLIEWELGFAAEEARDPDAMLAQGYRGSRYSFGYGFPVERGMTALLAVQPSFRRGDGKRGSSQTPLDNSD